MKQVKFYEVEYNPTEEIDDIEYWEQQQQQEHTIHQDIEAIAETYHHAIAN